MVERAAHGGARAARSRRAEAGVRALRRRGARPSSRRRSTPPFTPAGSRCASSATRRRRRSISTPPPSPPTRRCRSPAPTTGAAAPPRRSAEADEARRYLCNAPRPFRSPITASSPPNASGATRLVLRAPARAAAGARRATKRPARSTLLYAAGLDDLANALAYEAARSWTRRGAARRARRGRRAATATPPTNVAFGKIATERGYRPRRRRLPAFRRAGLPAARRIRPISPSVYAVARQESEFVWQAPSGAGAKGLMQILPSTARDDRAPRRRALRLPRVCSSIRPSTSSSARPISAS